MRSRNKSTKSRLGVWSGTFPRTDAFPSLAPGLAHTTASMYPVRVCVLRTLCEDVAAASGALWPLLLYKVFSSMERSVSVDFTKEEVLLRASGPLERARPMCFSDRNGGGADQIAELGEETDECGGELGGPGVPVECIAVCVDEEGKSSAAVSCKRGGVARGRWV